VKGKKGPPLCEEGQIINKGQVVCYLEQLGTQQPVEVQNLPSLNEEATSVFHLTSHCMLER
jgi:biotin carboxyl carrier protein